MRKINCIIVHCSDSDIPDHDNIETIRNWHVKERNFSDVGYHYFIQKNGTVEPGREEHRVGAHCQGSNSNSIGICLSGKNEFTKDQFKSLELLLIEICGKYDLEKKDILGHCDLNKGKSCPNFDLHGWLSGLPWH